MDVFEPGSHVGSDFRVAVPEQLFIVLAAPKLVGHKIPVQHGVAGRFRSEAESLEISPHHLLRMRAARNVPGNDNARLLPRKLDAEGNHFGFDRRTVLFPVPPGTHFSGSRSEGHQGFRHALRILRQAEVKKRHLQQLFARIAVLARRGFVDFQKTPLARIADEGRNRAALKKRLVLLLRQFGDFVVGRHGTRRNAPLGSADFAIDQAGDQAGDQCTDQGRETHAGAIFIKQGVEEFRQGLEKPRNSFHNRFDFPRQCH